jgi:hypothetical protein
VTNLALTGWGCYSITLSVEMVERLSREVDNKGHEVVFEIIRFF